jgi:outer membrane cobalamin receptor
MRFRFPLLVIALSVAAFAADLKITVSDPHSARVAGASARLYRAGSSEPVAATTTAGDGVAEFHGLNAGKYRIEVLAPGFARQISEVTVEDRATLDVTLAIAVPAESVAVTATRTPTPVAESGASVALLDREALRAMQPPAAGEALRFLPGAVVNNAGQRGGITGLFVRGGESRYNKVILDGVPVNEPGGVFDFGVVPTVEMDRLELVRGAESVLYGSDAMTSVVQSWSRTGTTRTPELRFGADGGTFATAHGFVSLAGARGRFDYNLFGEQFNTQGQGPNDAYSNAAQGANLGVVLTSKMTLRLRMRHANSFTGVPGAWDFNGQPRLAPDRDAFARQNNFLASVALTVAASARWQHRFSGYEYHHKGINQDAVADRGCDPASFNFLDCFFSAPFSINRAGFEYQGDYSPRDWAHTVFGYDFEDENGFFDARFLTLDFSGNQVIGTSHTHGLRRNHALYAEQMLTWRRLSVVAGARYVHNESFGDKVVPLVRAAVLVARGGNFFSGTRLRGSFAQGIQECSFQECFGITGTFPANPTPDLKPEENRAFEAGFEQRLLGRKAALSATYFHNFFHNQIAFTSDPVTFIGKFVNVNESLAHGAETEFQAQLRSSLRLDAAYVYTSTQVLKGLTGFPTGAPLLRRPKHSGTLLLIYTSRRWGGDLGGSFVGRRPDSDFLGLTPPVTYAAGYARVDLGGWFALDRHLTAYVQVGNALNRHYNEAVGYPALTANFRAGMRFRVGGD